MQGRTEMNAKYEYEYVHKTAKAITCTIVIGLLLFDQRSLDILAVIVWFFAVNPIGYLLEEICKIKHRHGKF